MDNGRVPSRLGRGGAVYSGGRQGAGLSTFAWRGSTEGIDHLVSVRLLPLHGRRGEDHEEDSRHEERVRKPVCAHVHMWEEARESQQAQEEVRMCGWAESRGLSVILTCFIIVLPSPNVVEGEVAGPRKSTDVPGRRGVRGLSKLQAQACVKPRSPAALTRISGTSRLLCLLV